MKVVCVLEDEDNIRELVQLVLESYQYKVYSYSNIKNFKEAKEATIPDIYLLDLMLPDGNGMDICQELKKNPQTKNIPIVIMSAHANLNQMQGADDYLPKPFNIDDLASIISKQL